MKMKLMVKYQTKKKKIWMKMKYNNQRKISKKKINFFVFQAADYIESYFDPGDRDDDDFDDDGGDGGD